MIPRFPNLRHLRALVAVAHGGGVSRAADAVHLSQPAITQALARMERASGLALFDRLPAGMEPTEAGVALVARAERALAELDRGIAEALAAAAQRGDAPRLAARLTAAGLRALLALSRVGNFTQAARMLEMSQPSVHRAARELERTLDLPLFRARARGVELTPAAGALARRVALAAAELEQAQMELSALAGQDRTRLTVGAMPLSRARILPRAFAAMIARHPHAQLRSVEGPYDDLLRGLRHGEIDLLIGALRTPPPAGDVREEPLFDDPLSVAVRAGHPLTRSAAPSLADTLDFPWVAPPRTSPAGQVLWRALGIADLPETPVKVVSSSQVMVRELLAEGDFVTIISPNQIRRELEDGRLATLPIALPGGRRPIGLTLRADWRPTPTQGALIDTIRRIAISETTMPGGSL